MKTSADVPQLVRDLIATSPDVITVGHRSYCVIDLDRPLASARIDEILEEFAPRDHLFNIIVAELWAQGRYLEVDEEQECDRSN
jgi:hypothetical protein